MKYVLLPLLLLTAVVSASAQTTDGQPWLHQLNVTAGLSFPMGSLATNLDLAPGLCLEGTFYLQLPERNVFLSASIGYHRFGYGSFSADLGMAAIPALVGARYNFWLTGVQPYVGLEAGAYFFTVTDQSNTVTALNDVQFGIVPKFGVRIPLQPQLDLDLSAKYHVVLTGQTNLQFLGINAGVAYTIE